MATIIAQRIESGAQKLLSVLPIERLTPRIVAEIPVKATGILAGTTQEIEWDNYNNPYIVVDGARVALAVVLTHKSKVFVYNRDGENIHGEKNTNTNATFDIIGAVGFGVSSLFYKIPTELTMKKVTQVDITDYLVVEETDGQGDKAVVKMPIVIVEVADVVGVEEHFVEVPAIAEGQTAKLQAAIRAITEKV